MPYKLGKLPVRHDARTLKLAKYAATLPPAPESCDWSAIQNLGIMLNDSLGDCVIAGFGHAVQGWNQYAGHPFIPADDDVLAAYEAVGGYTPGDPQSDQGCDMLTACNYWRQKGLAGHKIAAFVALDPSKPEEIKQAIALFGNCYFGLALPLSAQSQRVWVVSPEVGTVGPSAPGSWGGHCTLGVEYDRQGIYQISWGARLDMEWGFAAAYLDEAYALISQDWIEADKKSPSGFDWPTLLADLGEITQ